MSRSRIDREKTAEMFLSNSTIRKVENKENPEKEIKITEEKKNKRTRPYIKEGGYSQRAYYITDEQYKKLKILAVEKDTDTSSLVREALDYFLN